MSELLKWKKGGLKSPMSRAKGLGSAKDGVEHWIFQRVTAVSNLLLVIWFLWSLTEKVAISYDRLSIWLQSPINAILLILFTISTFYHAYLGVQVVTEDYVHNEGLKLVKLLTQKLIFFAGAVACIFAIVKISFGF